MEKYMKRLLFLLLITNSYVYPAAKPDIIRPVATHAMAMVFGYVTKEELAANSEIEPLILNPLTGNLENSGLITRLADLFSQNRAYILTNSSLFRAMIKKYPNIKLEGWRCKAISDFVYLFVQNSLLPPEIVNAVEQVPAIQAIEPYLGIKISNKTTISTDELRSPFYFKLPSKNLAEECANIIACFWDGTESKIFLTKADYATDAYKKMDPPPVIPTWGFLMLGFGEQSQSLANPNGLICGLQIPVFRKFLDFCNSQINTGIIVAKSSYFADINMVAALKEENSPELKKYQFPLVSISITAAPLLSGLGLNNSLDYNIFFTELLPPSTRETWRKIWQLNANNFETVISMACRPYHYFIGSQELKTTPAAIPMLREANGQFFIPARFGGSVVVIADTLIQPGLEKQPLYINQLTADRPSKSYQNPDIILLTTTKNFTRPLVLQPGIDKKLPTIIGINPGPTVYVFDELDAGIARISDVVDAFVRVPGLDQDQAFIIKKLHASNDLVKLVPVNRPQPEKTYFELKIVHQRPDKRGAEGENIVVVKQFDCTKNCTEPIAAVSTQKPKGPEYTVVAATQGDRHEFSKDRTDFKWGAIAPAANSDPAEALINRINTQKLPVTLGLFAH